jgi:hypothetical protein
MGLLDDAKKDLIQKLEDEKKKIVDSIGADVVDDLVFGDGKSTVGQDRFELLGQSIGMVVAFKILRSTETAFPRMELSFTDRGVYTFNGQKILGGTDATFQGFLNDQQIFYGQGNGYSVAESSPRTYATWFTEGVAQLEANLTGAGTYRGSMLYRWQEDGPFAVLNPMPAIFELTINSVGIIRGTIWRWVKSDSSSS